MVGLQLAFTYWAPMYELFGSAPIDGGAWLEVALAAVGAWLVIEAEKAFRRRADRSVDGGEGDPAKPRMRWHRTGRLMSAHDQRARTGTAGRQHRSAIDR